MFTQIEIPIIHEIKIGVAISSITLLFFIGLILLIQLRHAISPILKRASFWASLNMLFIGGLFILFELLTFDQFEPPESFEYILILAIVPFVSTTLWLLEYYPLKMSISRSRLVKFILLIWFFTNIPLQLLDIRMWKVFFDISLLLISMIISLRIIYSIKNFQKIPRQEGTISFTEYGNYRLAGIGIILLLIPSSFPVIFVSFLGKLAYILANLGVITGILVIVFTLIQEIDIIQTKTNQRYRQLIEEAKVGIMRTNEKGTITYYNKRLLEMLATNSITNDSFMDLIHKKDQQGVLDFFQSTVRRKDYVPKEDVFRVVGEELKWFQVKGVVHKDSFIFYIWDVSLEKSLSEIKNRFIATTSHELRTPLTILKGYNEFLTMNPDLNSDELGTITKASSRAILRLENLIANVHDLSRIEAQVFKINKEQVSFYEVYSEIQSQLCLLYPSRLFLINSHQLINRELYIDLHRLFQIIFNLVSNSVKHSDDKSIITIFIHDEGSKQLVITVEDKGVGISPKIMFSIGQPFIHETTPLSSQGTGLGLYIVMKILEASDGFLEFSSIQGEGSRFTVKIPAFLNPEV